MIEVKLNPDVTPAGSDLSIVNAARRSFNTRSDWDYGEEFAGVPGSDWFLAYPKLKEKDKRLLQFLARGMTADEFEEFSSEVLLLGGAEDYRDLVKYLWQWRNTPTHDTPFNHTFISFEVKAPIFVRAQLVKHEYLIMSEFSRRYITDDIEFYEPDKWRKAAENKKQGSSDEGFTLSEIYGWDTYDKDMYYIPLQRYNSLLKAGVAPEQARMVLPQSVLTEWTWSGTLGAFAKMCQLRLHPEAQYEARIVAEKVYEYLKEYYPVAAKALVEGTDV